ncbi:MAG: hypothetical protein EA415_16615 [Sphaerobacteraceae bacterium]|nr:MAG: hypothetical protein EA415_16615 [Sphaerobacteraceae bacterium]
MPVKHYTLNRIILGVAALYAVLIVTGIVVGPLTSSDEQPTEQAEEIEYTPGFEESAEEIATPHAGVGGVPADEPSVEGIIVSEDTGEPLAGVTVVAESDESGEILTTTGSDGRFQLKGIDDDVTVSFSLNGYATTEATLGPDDDHEIALGYPVLEGRISSVIGSPLRGATIAVGDTYTRSVENGVFELPHEGDASEIIVKAAGHETTVIPIDEFDGGIFLEPQEVSAVYIPASIVADPDEFASVLDSIDEAGLTGVVIDLKDHLGQVHYDSGVELAQEIEALAGTFDVDAVLDELESRDLYAIGRISTFEDPTLAEARPDLAIQDNLNDDLWRTWQGRAWANPLDSDVQAYNVALIAEAAGLGFDEIHLASAQFPEHGLVHRADYGQATSASLREQTISGFLDDAYAAIAGTESVLSASIFAMSLWEETNDVTGQDLQSMAERIDYINPLLYPSHFATGSLGVERPGEHPYMMVSRSLESGVEILPRHLTGKIRPWLQDFSYGLGIDYGAEEVREQIEAAESTVTSGWFLWNPDGKYNWDAHEPADEDEEDEEDDE